MHKLIDLVSELFQFMMAAAAAQKHTSHLLSSISTCAVAVLNLGDLLVDPCISCLFVQTSFKF